MNLLQRIKAAFSSDKVRNASFSLMQAGEGGAVRQPFSYDAAVRRYSSWIYAAANLNAVAVASQPLRLYVRRNGVGRKIWRTASPTRSTVQYLAGDNDSGASVSVRRKVAEFGGEFEMVTDTHPILDLLAKVNPYQNGFDATVLRVIYQELTGNAYLHPVLDETTGLPMQLWTLPTQWVEIVPSQDRLVAAYLYGSSRENRISLAPDEVIHFKRPNPANIFYGLGKLEAAWGVTMQNEQIHEMDLHWFTNKGRPDWLLTVRGDAHPDDLERLEAQIDEKLRGSKRTGRFLTATAELDIKPLQFPPKDITGRDSVVEEIAAIFGVPVSMLKANDPNLASATTGYAMWRETTVLPLLRMDEETLNQNLIPLFGLQEDAFLAYDNPVPKDKAFDLNRATSLVSAGIITRNEARKEAGLEPSADPMADALLVNGQPLGGAAPPPQPMLNGYAREANPPQAASPDAEEEDERVGTKSVLTKPRRRAGESVADCVERGIAQLISEGKDPDQAVAMANAMCGDGKSIEDIDTKPPQSVADNARRALEVRAEKPPSQRGMTEVGIARARDLANRENLSEDTIRRMVNYFNRHQSDKNGETWDEQGAGWQAWMGWGGDEGWAWARRKVEQFDRAREASKSVKNCGTGDGGFKPGNDCGSGGGGGGSVKPLSSRARKVVDDAPTDLKQAAKWRKEAEKAYQEDEDFKAFADGASFFTQGGFGEMQEAARQMNRGESPESHSAPLEDFKHPLAEYKPMLKGQELGTTKMKDAVQAVRSAIADSPPTTQPMYRGMKMPQDEARNNAFGAFLANAKVGDDFAFDVPTSFSAEKTVAEEFAQGIGGKKGPQRARARDDPAAGVVFAVSEGAKAASVTPLSPWKQQELLSEGKFKIKSIEGNPPVAFERTDLDFATGQERQVRSYGWSGRSGGVKMVITLEPA